MTDDLVEKARNSVFQKIGRNVCNLQKVEGLMKFLVVSHSGAYGTVNEMKARMRKLEESLTKKSMGMVAKVMFECVFGEPENIEAPVNLKGSRLSVKHSIEMDKETVEILEQALLCVIEERNNLIHHSVAKNDLKTIVGCRKFADELEVQNERIKSMHLTLNGFAKSTIEARKTLAAFMETEEFLVLFEGAGAEENESSPPN